MGIRSLAVVVVLCGSAAAEAEAEAGGGAGPREAAELQKLAHAKMRAIEYELAVPLLQRALTAEASRAQKAELNADLGICHASLGEPDHARTAFEAALSANPLLDLPVGTSPKIRQLFESVRAQGARATPSSSTLLVAASPPAGPRVKPVDYVLGAVALAAVAGGIYAGVVSSNTANELHNGLHDRATVDSLSSRQSLYGLISVGAYGLAGAAALSELLVILLLDRTGAPAPPRALSFSGGVPPSGGVFAAMHVRF